MLQKEDLPLFSRVIVEQILLNRMPENNYWYYFLLVQYMVSKVLCSNRVEIVSKKIGAKTSPNIYALLFSDSGNGKDRSHQIVKDCMKEYNLDIAMRAVAYADSESEKVEAYITLNNLTKAQATQYRQDHSPRFLLQEIDSNATLEGYIEARLALQQANFGCSCWEDSEIFDTIRSLSRGDKGTKALLTYNKEAFDNGNNKAKIIKGNKRPQTIVGVPHLVCLHGAVDEGEEVDEFLKGFFDFGFARRSLLFYDENTFLKSVRVTDTMLNEAIETESYAVNMFKELNEKFKPLKQVEPPHNRIVIFPDKEVENRYFEYEELCKNESKKYTGRHRKGVKIEVANRPWKALKLAVVLYCQDISVEPERSKEYTMPLSYFLLAERIVALYGDYFRSFYLKEGVCLEKQFADFILGSSVEVYKSTLATAKFLRGTYQQRLSIVDQLVDKGRLASYLSEQGKVLVEKQGGKTKKAIYYTIEDEPKEEMGNEDFIVRFSQAQSNEKYDQKLEPKECVFSELHKHTQQEKSYSPSVFKGDYRLGNNWTGSNDFIVLDVDNEVQKDEEQLTIEQAQERLKDYSYLIVQTKSHKLDKKGYGARDRYRIILPVIKHEVDIEAYKKTVANIVKHLKLDFKYEKTINGVRNKFFWVDEACYSPAMKYAGYNSEPIYNKGVVLNFKMYVPKEEAKPRVIYVNQSKEKNFKNPFEKNTILTVGRSQMTFPEYVAVCQQKSGRTVPCNCPFHGDKNPSAFITINKDGNFQFSCTVCGESKFCTV
jgi:hypothetical protein